MDALTATGGDPDKVALLYVQQYLHEAGYTEALQALEKQCGLLYDDGKLHQSSRLLQLVWRHMDEVMAEQEPEEGSREAQIAAEDEAMLRGGTGDYPQTIAHNIQGVHSTSIVCVRLIPGRDEIITGSGDGTLRRVTFTSQVQWCSSVGAAGGILCMDLHPTAAGTRSQRTSNDSASVVVVGGVLKLSHVLALGTMDGTVMLVNIENGDVLCSQKAHLKYVVRVTWAQDGQHLVSCSHDQTLDIHTVRIARTEGADEPSIQFSTIRKVQFLTSVQDAAFIPDGSLVVALRDTCFLRVMRIEEPEKEERQVNLNASKDTHISFFARHLVPSPCGRFLLVCTDTGRNLVLRTKDWELARYVLQTPPTGQFHQFCAAWHWDSHYVFLGAAGAQVWVTHVGSGKVVCKVQVHSVNVRDMCYDPDRNILVTASFDKTVKVLTHTAHREQQEEPQHQESVKET